MTNLHGTRFAQFLAVSLGIAAVCQSASADFPSVQEDFVNSFMQLLTSEKPIVASDVHFYFGAHTEFNEILKQHCEWLSNSSNIEICINRKNEQVIGPNREQHFFTALQKLLDLEASWELKQVDLVEREDVLPFYDITVVLGDDELKFAGSYAKDERKLLYRYGTFGRLSLYKVNGIKLRPYVLNTIK